MDVHRVRQLQFVRRLGDAADDLPRRDVEVIDAVDRGRDVAAWWLLPDFDAAGIDELRGIALGRRRAARR